MIPLPVKPRRGEVLAHATASLAALAGLGAAVLYADPPWRYHNWTAKGERRNPITHYRCLEVDQLRALPVGAVARRDAFLFMWVTTPMVARGTWRGVMRAWGFEPSALVFCWVKTRAKCQDEMFLNRNDVWHMGLGYTTRHNVELCFLGRRGNPKRLDRGIRELIVEPVREHSRKPEEARARIMRYAAGPYVELFAREAAEGWTSWGDEIRAAPVFVPRRPRLRLIKR